MSNKDKKKDPKEIVELAKKAANLDDPFDVVKALKKQAASMPRNAVVQGKPTIGKI